MTLEDLSLIAQIASVLLVPASLVFVGMQMRQTHAIERGNAQRDLLNQTRDWWMTCVRHPFDYGHQFDATTYRYLNGADVGRYQLDWSGQWLRWGPWLSQPRDMSLFTGGRVLIREITGAYPRVLISTYVSDTYLNNKSIINILPKNKNSDMKYLVGPLNSKLLSFFHSRRAVKSNRLMFPKAVLSDVNGYPIIYAEKDIRLYQPALIMTHAPTCAARWS